MAATPVTGSTAYSINDPRTQILWSKKFFRFSLENTIFSSWMGNGENTPIAKVTDLTVKKGGSIVFELPAALRGNGVGDHDRHLLVDGSNTFTTEGLKDYNYTLPVHRRGNAVQAAGIRTNQYTSTNVKTSGLMRLTVWMGEAIEDDLISAGSGVGNVTETGAARTSAAGTAIQTVNGANPTQNRYFAIGEDEDGVISYAKIDGTSTSDITANVGLPLNSFTAPLGATDPSAEGVNTSRFGTRTIEFLKRKAREVITDSFGGVTLQIPKITPIKLGGKDQYALVISRLQEKSLKADKRWNENQQNANVRGEKNPIFSGAIGIWDGVIIKVSERMQYRIGLGGVAVTEYFNDFSGATVDTIHSESVGMRVDRGLFLGANAITIAFAQMPQKTTTMEDIGTIEAVAVNALYGTGAPKFNYFNTSSWTTEAGTDIGTEQYGVIVFDTIVDVD